MTAMTDLLRIVWRAAAWLAPLLALSLGQSFSALAQPNVPQGGPALLELAQDAGLSQDQVTKIRKLSFATHREIIGLEAKLATARLDLQEAMESDPPPAEGKAMGLVDKIGKLETELNKKRVLMMLRVRKTMSVAQWQKLQMVRARHLRPPGEGPPRPPARPSPPSPPPRP